MTAELFSELYDAFMGSDVVQMPNSSIRIMIKPTPVEAEEMVAVVRDVLKHGGWKIEESE